MAIFLFAVWGTSVFNNLELYSARFSGMTDVSGGGGREGSKQEMYFGIYIRVIDAVRFTPENPRIWQFLTSENVHEKPFHLRRFKRMSENPRKLGALGFSGWESENFHKNINRTASFTFKNSYTMPSTLRRLWFDQNDPKQFDSNLPLENFWAKSTAAGAHTIQLPQVWEELRAATSRHTRQTEHQLKNIWKKLFSLKTFHISTRKLQTTSFIKTLCITKGEIHWCCSLAMHFGNSGHHYTSPLLAPGQTQQEHFTALRRAPDGTHVAHLVSYPLLVSRGQKHWPAEPKFPGTRMARSLLWLKMFTLKTFGVSALPEGLSGFPVCSQWEHAVAHKPFQVCQIKSIGDLWAVFNSHKPSSLSRVLECATQMSREMLEATHFVSKYRTSKARSKAKQKQNNHNSLKLGSK